MDENVNTDEIPGNVTPRNYNIDKVQDMTTIFSSAKRKLELNPSTPVGLLKKHQQDW